MQKRNIFQIILAIVAFLVPVVSSHARWMNPNAGRFWTMDTYEGTEQDPQSLHKYAYAANEPVNKTDPSGHMTIAFALNSAAVAGTRTGWESARAPSYAGGLARARALAEIAGAITAGYLAADFAMERTGLREHLEKAKEEFRKRFRNQNVPKVVPMPRSVIPTVAAHVAAHQAANPNSIMLTRASVGVNIINRARVLRGRGSAGPGMSWDEYPFASSQQGGNLATVTVVPVPRRENLVQGGIIMGSYIVENINPGDRFAVVVIP
jgi:hypothetical protein